MCALVRWCVVPIMPAKPYKNDPVGSVFIAKKIAGNGNVSKSIPANSCSMKQLRRMYNFPRSEKGFHQLKRLFEMLSI